MRSEFLKLLESGFSVIPVSQSKRPLISWRPYQQRVATVAEVDAWLRSFPDCRPAIVTGKLSGVVIVDHDSSIPDLLGGGQVVKSPRGWHEYFQYPESGHVVTCGDLESCVDVRGDGGIVVVYGELDRGLMGACPDHLVVAGDWLRRGGSRSRRRSSGALGVSLDSLFC